MVEATSILRRFDGPLDISDIVLADGSWESVHRRLRTDIGRARDFPCVTCGGRADQWALDWGRAEGHILRRIGRPGFSLAFRDYAPMCISDHMAMDAHQPFTPDPALEVAAIRYAQGRTW